jgi:hypothetical protein
VTTIIPPVTTEEDGYELVITAYIVDFYSAKAQVNRTIVVKPPKYDETTTAVIANGSYPYNLTAGLCTSWALISKAPGFNS